MRRQNIDAKRDKIQEKFIEDSNEMHAAFRKTTRDYHVEKEHMKLLHGAPIGRYSPSYERVWSKAPVIAIAGVKDRFGYENKNSPNFVKVAEGQASAAGITAASIVKAVLRGERKSVMTSNSKDKIAVSPTSRNQANKTMIQFKKKGNLSISESLEQINAQTMATANKTTKSNFKTAKNSSVGVVNIVVS